MASKQSEFAREAAAQPTPKTAAEVTPGPPRWWRTFPSQRWHEAIVVALVVVAAMSIRLEDLVVWTSAPEIFFHQGEPMPASLDSGFYLTLARDLVEGNCGPVDTWRAVPDYPPRPMPPPQYPGKSGTESIIQAARLTGRAR